MAYDFQNELASVKKKGDAPEKISKEELAWRVQELKKCRDDIIYFANHYYRTISPDVNGGKGGLGLIKVYPKQEELLKFFQKYNRVVAMAARQSGKCVFTEVNITIRNKKTGEIKEIPIGEFYEKMKSSQNSYNHE